MVQTRSNHTVNRAVDLPRQVMSLETFVRLVQTLPPERIARIQIEHLPENIPANITEKLPMASRGAVEDLLLAASSYHLSRRIEDQEKYGEGVVRALDRARVIGDAATIRVFKDKILGMIAMLQEYQRNRDRFTIGLFVKNIVHINDLLIDVRSEYVALNGATSTLSRVQPESKSDGARIGTALETLKRKRKDLDKLLGEFFVLRLKIMAQAIAAKRRESEKYEALIANIPPQIEALRKQLDGMQSLWQRTVNRQKSNSETRTLQDRIAELVHEMDAKEVVISETDLTLWLDTIVDASINDFAKQRVAKAARDARISLYYLLNKFCQRQEQSALQIAQNPFLKVEPEKAIKYVLMSEQFILDYFANKKKDTTKWLSGAAKVKIGELDRLEKDILSELRRSSKIRIKR